MKTIIRASIYIPLAFAVLALLDSNANLALVMCMAAGFLSLLHLPCQDIRDRKHIYFNN